MDRTAPGRSNLSHMWVPVQVGELVYAIPEMTAALLEQNLRGVPEWDDYQAEAATTAADRIGSFRDGTSAAPVVFAEGERPIVAKSMDALLGGPHGAATVRAVISELRARSLSRRLTQRARRTPAKTLRPLAVAPAALG